MRILRVAISAAQHPLGQVANLHYGNDNCRVSLSQLEDLLKNLLCDPHHPGVHSKPAAHGGVVRGMRRRDRGSIRQYDVLSAAISAAMIGGLRLVANKAMPAQTKRADSAAASSARKKAGTSGIRKSPPKRKKRALSLSQRAYEKLVGMILSGEMPPGTSYLEKTLWHILGMSRTPVREALIRLERENLIRIVPRHGIQIAPISVADQREIYDVLTAVETHAAELAAKRRPEADELRPMEQALVEMETALVKQDRGLFVAADARFHYLMVELCRNRRLIEIAHNHWNQTLRARWMTMQLVANLDISAKEHRSVLDQIRRGNAEGAREAHRVHRERGGAAVLDILERIGIQRDAGVSIPRMTQRTRRKIF